MSAPILIEEQSVRRSDVALNCNLIVRQSCPRTLHLYRTENYRFLIDDVRAALRSAGFSRTARIAIAIPNGPQAALAIVAVSCSAVSIPLNPKQTLREIKTSLATLQVNAMLLVEGSASAARRAAEETGTTILEASYPKEGSLGFAIIEPQSSAAAALGEFAEPDPDSPIFILQTSGTTSEPKLVPFSHKNMLAAAARLQTWFDLTPKDRCLSVSPLFYSHGLKVTVFTPLLTGGAVVFPRDISKFDYAEWFSFLEPTWYSTGPTLHRLILDQSRGDAKTGHSLRFILSGGAPLPQNVLKGLQAAFGIPVVEHYGSSEAAQISANLPPAGRSKPGTCGIPPNGTIIIVGDDGRRLPPGEQGEILVGGPTVISGYLNAPELNSASFIDGWFRSGDIGSIDEEGFLTLHGRKHDVINRGGEKIAPAEIDEALMRHPAVLEAAAFSIPHPRLGEDVAAVVALRPGMTVSPFELRRYLQDQIALFKVPRRIIVRDQIPKGTTGKIKRRLLTESWEEMITAVPHVAAAQAAVNLSAENPVVDELLAVWERLLNKAPLSLDDDFFEKGGDSLLAVEMLTELEWRTGLAIPDTILFEATTIRTLSQKLVEQRIPGPKQLIKMNSDGSQPPLIYFHGNFHGTGHSAITLAKLLGSDQPLFIVVPHGTDGKPIPHSIEAMAADRLPLILNAQPEGPYRLGGKCLGGIVAFEVARMLVAAGKEVELVIMLDPPTVNTYRSVQILFSAMKLGRPIGGRAVERAMARAWFRCVELQKGWMKLHKFWNFSWTKRWAAIQRRWVAIVTKLRDRAAGENDQGHAEPTIVDRWSGEPIFGISLSDSRTLKYAAAMSKYVPKPLDVRVTYIGVDFGVGAWGRISPNPEVVKSSGTHDFPHFAIVADHFRARLQPRN